MARGGKRAGAGRKRGSKNHEQTGELRQMILDALGNAGGVTYLEARARDTPNAFLALIGRVLPLQHEGGDPTAPVRHVVEYESVAGKPDKV